jgi:Domain of unknown function (DUF4272)
MALRSRLRSTREAVGRARALAAVVRHARGAPQDPKGLALSPHEQTLLTEPAAAWNAEDVVDAVWRGEALGTIVWALGEAELPPYDTPFDHASLAGHLELEDVELRDDEEVDAEREVARLWHWRARTALLQREERLELPGRWRSGEQLVAASAMVGHERGLLPLPVRGDFPAFGRPFRELDDQQVTLVHSIAAERHYALEWLCGAGPDWDSIRTDT